MILLLKGFYPTGISVELLPDYMILTINLYFKVSFWLSQFRDSIPCSA